MGRSLRYPQAQQEVPMSEIFRHINHLDVVSSVTRGIKAWLKVPVADLSRHGLKPSSAYLFSSISNRERGRQKTRGVKSYSYLGN